LFGILSKRAAEKAEAFELYDAGQGILKTAFGGNVRGIDPGLDEIKKKITSNNPSVYQH